MKIAPKPQDKYHGRGIGLNKLDFCVGSPVRCTRNLCTMAGLYQGARGVVVGFGFPDKKNPHKSSKENDQENTTKPEDYTFDSLDNTLEKATLRDKYRTPQPLVYVQMDKGDFKSFFTDMDRVVCFSAIPQQTTIDGKYTRWIHPLILAHASTYHKAQGLTLENGVVVQLPGPNAELGLTYVGISRVTDLKFLTLLKRPLEAKHFTTRKDKRKLIVAEYERLRHNHSVPTRVATLQQLEKEKPN